MIKKFLKHDQELTSGPITPKVLSLTGPLMAIAILNSTLNLIDMFWVGKLGSDSIAAVAISGTIMMVVFAALIGLTRGTVALVSRYVGAKDAKNADAAASQSIMLGLIIAFAAILVGLLFTEKLLLLLGASQEVLKIGTSYLRILLIGGITMVLLSFGNAILQAEGDTVTPMKFMFLSNIINIVLDPILIFGLSIIPKMEAAGAALATVLAQAIPAFLVLALLYTRQSKVHIHISQFKIKFVFIKEMIRIGLPASLQMFFRSIMGVVLMGIVASFGTAAVAAYGIGMRLQMVVLMPAFAFGGAAATLVGQNLGARKSKRAQRSAWTATSLDMCIMILVGILFFIFAPGIIRFFTKDNGIISLGTEFLRVTAPFYVFIPLGVVLGQALAGAGDTMGPMFITLISLWGFQIPMALLLSKLWGANGIWWANAFASVLHGTFIMGWFMTGKWKKRKISSIA
ncbi:MAG: MATE family efflux transporter [Candidatus Ratteibacteria bacterium]|nr:MATE family efflux transporter [Candidatus Ratteibacteria bacterium]